ncbi:fimbrial protein [Providencia sp. Me31A]|uniref:fimbrial protein n=1 Tax=Providencia sp. Me31A TaxID=3392637 RepID=UPI003D27C822
MTKINLAIVGGLLGLTSQVALSNNVNTVNYEGTLINMPCIIDEDTPILVNMGNLVDHQIYLHGRSIARKFELILKECDPSLANSVKITLQAPPGNITTDGYLEFDRGSTAKGAVIGISEEGSMQSNRVLIGSSLKPKTLKAGTMTVPLYAYLSAKPGVVAAKSIVPGPYTATLYYLLNFE